MEIKKFHYKKKRLHRMLLQLQKYNLKVVYKQRKDLYIADTLGRTYL